MRIDVLVAYTFTAVFAIAIVLIAARVFDGVPPADHDIITRMAGSISENLGPSGYYLYSVGFWAAVVASLLGAWQTVPFLMADCYALLRGARTEVRDRSSARSSRARSFALAFLTVSGVTFAFVDRPLALIVTYTIVASGVVPFLAAVLLYLNTRVKWHGPVRHNSIVINVLLLLALILFIAVAVCELGAA